MVTIKNDQIIFNVSESFSMFSQFNDLIIVFNLYVHSVPYQCIHTFNKILGDIYLHKTSLSTNGFLLRTEISIQSRLRLEISLPKNLFYYTFWYFQCSSFLQTFQF